MLHGGTEYLDVAPIYTLAAQEVEQLQILAVTLQHFRRNAVFGVLHAVQRRGEQVQVSVRVVLPVHTLALACNGHALMLVNGQQHGGVIAAHMHTHTVGDLLLIGIAPGLDAQRMSAGGTAVQSGFGIALLKFTVQAVELFALLQGAVPAALALRHKAAVVFQVAGVAVHAQVVGAKLLLLFAQHVQYPLISILLGHVDGPVVPVAVEVQHPLGMLHPHL